MRGEVFWIGTAEAPELVQILSALQASVPLQKFAQLADLAPYAASLSMEPALLLLVQRLPGEASAEEVAAVRRRFPLARWLTLLGSWCEGEPRSGKPLPGVARLYWHQWSPRVLGEIRKLAAGEPSEWSLPATAAAEERLSSDPSPAAREPRSARPLIALQTDQREMAEALAALLEQTGFAPCWCRCDCSPTAEIAATVVDLGHGCQRAWHSLAETCRATRRPVLALLSFPRPEDATRARDLGASELLSKPLDSRDLVASLNAFARHAGP